MFAYATTLRTPWMMPAFTRMRAPAMDRATVFRARDYCSTDMTTLVVIVVGALTLILYHFL